MKLMTEQTRFIFRLKCIIKKCRERGKFLLALKIRNKYA